MGRARHGYDMIWVGIEDESVSVSACMWKMIKISIHPFNYS